MEANYNLAIKPKIQTQNILEKLSQLQLFYWQTISQKTKGKRKGRREGEGGREGEKAL